jgi:hypothetical protein
MPSVSPRPRSNKRSRSHPHAEIIHGLDEFLRAAAHVAQARSLLVQAQATSLTSQREHLLEKVRLYTDAAREKLDQVAARAPGLRRRCAEQQTQVDQAYRQATEASWALSAPRTSADVVDLATVRLRRAAQASTVQ